MAETNEGEEVKWADTLAAHSRGDLAAAVASESARAGAEAWASARAGAAANEGGVEVGCCGGFVVARQSGGGSNMGVGSGASGGI